MDEREFVIGDIETTGVGTYKFDDPKRKFVKDVKEELEEVRGLDLHKSSEAEQMYNLPGAEHLNPKLTAAVILFRYRTKNRASADINPKTRNTHMQGALNHFFPEVKSGTKRYMLLKGDMIRYITLVEEMKKKLE